jgi:type I restriction-modification system DNA methylase subunit
MLEAIIAMPDQLFYNTGISTYIWIVTDRKSKERKGKVQLINATGADKDEKDNPFYSIKCFEAWEINAKKYMKKQSIR